ncbi:helix-turn-helix domain-containing protein [Leisingera caerulea]|uniref:helix-turn-helix domain-containing protein n=1 Tax=Leisingera caerulea TaxID=506591 RepID=UPI0003FD92C4|nr:helix-turn-helix domain-containing protein [Leisingera caerulea]
MADPQALDETTQGQEVPSPKRRLHVSEIIEVVRVYYRLGKREITGPSRERRVSWPRQMAMAMIRSRTSLSTPQIAEALHLQCHTTVCFGLKQVRERCQKRPDIKADYDELRRQLAERAGSADFIRHEHAHGRPFSTVRAGRG